MMLFTRLAVLSLIVLSSLTKFQSCWAEQPLSSKTIILDAGSSGSRIMAYFLDRDPNSGIFDLKNQSQLIEDAPLSLRSDFSSEVSNFIKYHLGHLFIYQQSAPHFFLGATAGMRELQGTLSRDILYQKQRELQELGVNALFQDNLKLLSGLEEGSYTWFGINFILRAQKSKPNLKDRIQLMAEDHRQQYGIVEMGGGSVQVAFSLPEGIEHKGLKFENNDGILSHQVPNVKTFTFSEGYSLNVFSESFPGMGLNFASRRIENHFLSNPQENPCLNSDHNSFFYPTAHSTAHPIRETTLRGSYQRCKEGLASIMFSSPKATFNGQPINDPFYKKHLPKRFFLTGYFYDRTVAKGLPSIFTISTLEKIAHHICHMDRGLLHSQPQNHNLFSQFSELPLSTISSWQKIKSDHSKSGTPRPFDISQYCTHLTYMTLFLQNIGITDEHELITSKSLRYHSNEFGTSWPLGYAIITSNGWNKDRQ